MYSDLDEVISKLSLNAVLISSVLLLALTLISVFVKKLGSLAKKVLFGSVVLVTILCTVFLAGSTIYLNQVSSSGGPVHWHSDIEIWACGKEINLKDPKGISNKIGTSTLHEHNDKRIHLEGVVVEPKDASLGKFFKVIGGNISASSLHVPTSEGIKSYVSGADYCYLGDGSELDGNLTLEEEAAQVQVFVFKVEGKNYVQTKVSNPESYIISPESQVPNGDCIIIEYDQPMDFTDRLCRSFIVAEQIGKLEGEAGLTDGN